MADFYIKASGSGTSPYDTWAKAAATSPLPFAVPPSAGDRVFISNTYYEDGAAGAHWAFATASSSADPVLVVSTDDDTTEPPTTYASGARVGGTQGATGNVDWTAGISNGEGAYVVGVHCIAEDDCSPISNDGTVTYEDCLFSGDDFNGGTRGVLIVRNSTWQASATGAFGGASVSRGGQHKLQNITLDNTYADATNLFNAMDTTEPPNLEIDGLDATAANSVGGFELFSFASVGQARLKLSNVLLPTSGTIFDGTVSAGGVIDIRGYGINGASPNLGGVYYKSNTGAVTSEFTTVRNATYDGTNKYSLCFEPTANAIRGLTGDVFTLTYHICEFWADANATIKIWFTSDTGSLTDNQCWMEIDHPQSSNALKRTMTSSIHPHYMLGTPTALTTETDDWTSGKTSTYSISETLTSSAGVHRVAFCVANDATTPVVYVDPAIDVS